MVSAICLVLFAKTVAASDGLVNVIPDKSALVSLFSVGKVCVFEHATVGVSHGVCVLAADKWLVRVFFKELLYACNRRIHLAFHIAGVVVGSVMADSLIVNESVRIKLSKELTHLKWNFSTVRLISDRPDKY